MSIPTSTGSPQRPSSQYSRHKCEPAQEANGHEVHVAERLSDYFSLILSLYVTDAQVFCHR